MTGPLALLASWIDDAGGPGDAGAVAMCLGTADGQGRPSARMVLLRGLDDRGLRFYTSYESRKGRDLAANPFAAAVFYWRRLDRQVRVEGSVSELTEDESDAYFAARPRGHRLAAWSSEQSDPIDALETLAERFAHFQQRFAEEDVPRPHSWGGYLLVPSRVEFWTGRPNRMHERTLYTRDNNTWHATLLQP